MAKTRNDKRRAAESEPPWKIVGDTIILSLPYDGDDPSVHCSPHWARIHMSLAGAGVLYVRLRQAARALRTELLRRRVKARQPNE